jgi:hypothetical protein
MKLRQETLKCSVEDCQEQAEWVSVRKYPEHGVREGEQYCELHGQMAESYGIEVRDIDLT